MAVMTGVRRASDVGLAKVQIFISPSRIEDMTVLSFDEQGVDVVYEGTEFRLEKALIEDAIGKSFPDVTDHEVLQIVEPDPSLSGEPQKVSEIVE
jgi:hypothetical protein